MLKYFGSLYAGHVDLGDIGLDATAVNDRRFDNDRLITIFDRVEKMVKVMDDLGYHSFWVAEHHFQHEGNEVIPNLLLVRKESPAIRLPSITFRRVRSSSNSIRRPTTLVRRIPAASAC